MDGFISRFWKRPFLGLDKRSVKKIATVLKDFDSGQHSVSSDTVCSIDSIDFLQLFFLHDFSPPGMKTRLLLELKPSSVTQFETKVVRRGVAQDGMGPLVRPGFHVLELNK
jgi:hypothetical protein